MNFNVCINIRKMEVIMTSESFCILFFINLIFPLTDRQTLVYYNNIILSIILHSIIAPACLQVTSARNLKLKIHHNKHNNIICVFRHNSVHNRPRFLTLCTIAAVTAPLHPHEFKKTLINAEHAPAK